MAYKVLVTTEDFKQDYTECIKTARERGVECVWKPLPKGYQDTEGLIALASGYDAVIAGGECWSAGAITALAGKLKVISRAGIGYDKIDLDAADRAGVYVTNTPGSFSNAVAEGALALMLAAVKNVVQFDAEVRKGVWEPFLGNEIKGRTVGFLGFGSIAQRLAELLMPFEVRMLAFDTRPDLRAAEKYQVKYMDMDEVFREADILSLHMPLNRQTKGILNDRSFGEMKDGVVLVNTARGGLIEEAALIRALESGKVGAAGLDVFETEPVKRDNPLLRMRNVVIYPHATSLTHEAYKVTFNMAVDNILEALSGGPVKHQINRGARVCHKLSRQAAG